LAGISHFARIDSAHSSDLINHLLHQICSWFVIANDHDVDINFS
jgi:hypothetical protein